MLVCTLSAPIQPLHKLLLAVHIDIARIDAGVCLGFLFQTFQVFTLQIIEAGERSW